VSLKGRFFIKIVREFFQTKILPLPSYLFIRLLWVTLKVEFSGLDNIKEFCDGKKNYILAFWHGTLLLMIYAFKGNKRTFLVSYHRDGELITRVIKKFGIDATRGSSTKGGTRALLLLLRRAKNGYSIAFTPDGPRGPARKSQNGVVELARLSKLPVIPVGFFSKRCKEMKSWDSFVVPYPFTKVAFHYGKPIYIKDEDKDYAKEVEDGINYAEEEAKKIVLRG
jgi:lysophospholipid acyltransferase (LPLAT)-like uncharacterized protein